MPDVEALERRMRPGFLGQTERLEDVLAADASTLAKLGITRQEIVEPLSLLIDAPYTVMADWNEELDSAIQSKPEWQEALKGLGLRRKAIEERFGLVECTGYSAARLGGRYDVTVVQYMGFVACPWGEPFGEVSCGPRGSGDWWIRDTKRGVELDGPSLITHLIEEHGFFEGVESPYGLTRLRSRKCLNSGRSPRSAAADSYPRRIVSQRPAAIGLVSLREAAVDDRFRQCVSANPTPGAQQAARATPGTRANGRQGRRGRATVPRC